jgi:hypothetical protein
VVVGFAAILGNGDYLRRAVGVVARPLALGLGREREKEKAGRASGKNCRLGIATRR